MSHCHSAVFFSLFVFVAFSSVAFSSAKKPIVQQQQTVAELKKQQQKEPKVVEPEEQVLQPTKQLQQEESPPTPQCTPQKLRKPKSLKALTEYELCKQECRRKRDQESSNEYIEYLKEELRLAEERAETEALQQQQQQYANGF